MSEFVFHRHLLERMAQRGATSDEVMAALQAGTPAPARPPAEARAIVFEYHALWEGRFYEEKQVVVYFKRDEDELIVLTVICRYGSGFDGGRSG